MAGMTAQDSFDRYERALYLSEEEGKNGVEIAEILDVHPTTVYKMLKEARHNREQRLAREKAIWELRQRGLTHQQIGDQLGLDRTTITKALRRICLRILEDFDNEIKRARVEQWSQLDFIVAEALEGWQRSKEASKKVTQKREIEQLVEEGDETKAAVRDMIRRATGEGEPSPLAQITVTTQVIDEDGDIRFLKEARDAMTDLRKLLGMEAPTKIAQTDPTGQREASRSVMLIIPDNMREGAELPEIPNHEESNE